MLDRLLGPYLILIKEQSNLNNVCGPFSSDGLSAISMELSIMYFIARYKCRYGRSKLLKEYILLCLKVVSIQASSADSDEMLHFAAFHLGLHCLQKTKI